MTSIGKDLATIRHHQKLTIENIHQRTRISLEILKKIENGTLFTDPVENKIYIRSFVRTYARALKIDEELVVKALDQHEAGNYNRLLLDAFPDIDKDRAAHPVHDPSGDETRDPSPPPSASSDTASSGGKTAGTEDQTVSSEKKEAATGDQTATTGDKPASTGDQTLSGRTESASPDLPTPPTEGQIDWVKLGNRFAQQNRQGASWIIGTIILVIVLMATFYLIYRSDLFPDTLRQQETEMPAPVAPAPGGEGAGLSLDLADREPGTEPGAVTDNRLDETLYLTVYAATERLDPVRIWSDLKPRIDPYWLEQGHAYNFEFRDTIRVQGQYNRMLLFLNGHRIDNFRQQQFNEQENAVELTRDFFRGDSRWASSVPLQLPDGIAPPDSVENRPVF